MYNLLGAALGAASASLRAVAARGGPFAPPAASAFLPGAEIDLGLALIGLWLFIQLNPASLLFGAGDRGPACAARGRARRPEFFVSIEALTTAANLIAVAADPVVACRPSLRSACTWPFLGGGRRSR